MKVQLAEMNVWERMTDSLRGFNQFIYALFSAVVAVAVLIVLILWIISDIKPRF